MQVHLKAWRSALAKCGLMFPTTRFYELAGKPLAEIVEILAAEQGVSPTPCAQEVRLNKDIAWESGLACEIQAVHPAQEVLEHARLAGLKIAVASGGQRKDVIASLATAGYIRGTGEDDVREVFDAVVTAEDVQVGKPHPETFLLAAKRLNVDPARCVGLEDAVLGLQALQSAGMRAVDIRTHRNYPLPHDLKSQILTQQRTSLPSD